MYDEDFGFGEWEEAKFPTIDNVIPIFDQGCHDYLRDEEEEDEDQNFIVKGRNECSESDSDSSDSRENAALEVFSSGEEEIDDELKEAMAYLKAVRIEASSIGKVSVMNQDVTLVEKKSKFAEHFKVGEEHIHIDDAEAEWRHKAIDYFLSIRQCYFNEKRIYEVSQGYSSPRVRVRKLLQQTANIADLLQYDMVIHTKLLKYINTFLHNQVRKRQQNEDRDSDASCSSLSSVSSSSSSSPHQGEGNEIKKMKLLNMNHWLLYLLALIDQLHVIRSDIGCYLKEIQTSLGKILSYSQSPQENQYCLVILNEKVSFDLNVLSVCKMNFFVLHAILTSSISLSPISSSHIPAISHD